MNAIYGKYRVVRPRICTVGLFLFVLLWLSLVVYAQGDLTNIAGQANVLYEQGDYAGAINLYESLVAAEIRDGAIYFNLGNAYFQTQNLGKALLNYRRAQLLIPLDGELNTNMAWVRAERVDIQGDETMLVDSLASLTSGVLTLSELSWVTLILWMLFFGVLAAWVVRVDWRDVLRVPLIAASTLMISTVVMLGSRLFVESNRPAALAVNDTAVMSGPGEDYLEIYRLYSAAELRVLEQRGDWVRFILPDQRQGWIQKAMIEIV
jgi:tetratricopeptide (TPR) repeat protein